MKADSVGLEIEVQLDRQESLDLKDKTLAGFLNFRDNSGSPRHAIPFKLRVGKTDSSGLRASLTPRNVYFGYCREITMIISRQWYAGLIDRGYCAQRFLLSGKLEIFIDGH